MTGPCDICEPKINLVEILRYSKGINSGENNNGKIGNKSGNRVL